MIQDKLLKEGSTIVICALPHTPPIGVAEVTKVEHGMVELLYRRNDEPAKSRSVKISRSDAVYLIVQKMWLDPETIKTKPALSQGTGEVLEGYVIDELDNLSLMIVETLRKNDEESVKVHFDRGTRLFWERMVRDARA